MNPYPIGNAYAAASYPEGPGCKTGGTSQAAAVEMAETAETIRDRVLDLLRDYPMTADLVATQLELSILSVRPRLSELRAMGLIVDTGRRGTNTSGKRAIVWMAKGDR